MWLSKNYKYHRDLDETTKGGKGKNLWINYLMLAKCSNEEISNCVNCKV